MSRVREISDKFFNRDDASSTLAEFVDDITDAENRNSSVGIRSRIAETLDDAKLYRLLSDRGNGQIYEGLRSLELMSRTIKGVGTTSLFDNVILAYTADDMKRSDDPTGIRIANTNIGIQEIYEYAKSINSVEVAAYDRFATKIVKQIRAGGFKTDEHIQEALIRVKALIRSTLNFKRAV